MPSSEESANHWFRQPGGSQGLDCSPKGDKPGFVQVEDDGRTLLIPDRRGNNRIDSIKNLVEDPRVALIFLVPGANETYRVNGRARRRGENPRETPPKWARKSAIRTIGSAWSGTGATAGKTAVTPPAPRPCADRRRRLPRKGRELSGFRNASASSIACRPAPSQCWIQASLWSSLTFSTSVR